jgi:hypothetical protein
MKVFKEQKCNQGGERMRPKKEKEKVWHGQSSNQNIRRMWWYGRP